MGGGILIFLGSNLGRFLGERGRVNFVFRGWIGSIKVESDRIGVFGKVSCMREGLVVGGGTADLEGEE